MEDQIYYHWKQLAKVWTSVINVLPPVTEYLCWCNWISGKYVMFHTPRLVSDIFENVFINNGTIEKYFTES